MTAVQRTSVNTFSQASRSSGPDPRVTNSNAAMPVDAPIKGDPANRNRAKYDQVLNQFGVESNPRYRIRDSNGDGRNDTFCNIFVSDVTKAMGAPIPHWVDSKGNPSAPGRPNSELNANATVGWMNQHGAKHGWRKVSPAEAQQLANQGHPAAVLWKNPRGIGHVAMVRPGR
jgi:hypothetical protein